MIGDLKTDNAHLSPEKMNEIRDLSLVFSDWENAVYQADNADLEQPDLQRYCDLANDCERIAKACKATSIEHMAMKTVMVLLEIPDQVSALGQSLLDDARRIISDASPDSEIEHSFGLWHELRDCVNQDDLGDAHKDQMFDLATKVRERAAIYPAGSARALSQKIVMSLDLGATEFPIVASTRRDIERLSGSPLRDI